MSTKTITVEVTQEDLEDGQAGNCRWCPVAMALKRHGWKYPMVGCARAQDEYEEDSPMYLLDQATRDRIEEFDEGGTIQPFVARMTEIGTFATRGMFR